MAMQECLKAVDATHWCFQPYYPGRVYYPFPGAESFVPHSTHTSSTRKPPSRKYPWKSKASNQRSRCGSASCGPLQGKVVSEWPLPNISLGCSSTRCHLERHFFEFSVSMKPHGERRTVFVYCVRSSEGAPLVDGYGLAEIHLATNMDDLKRAFQLDSKVDVKPDRTSL